jgi:hypothetical protein
MISAAPSPVKKAPWPPNSFDGYHDDKHDKHDNHGLASLPNESATAHSGQSREHHYLDHRDLRNQRISWKSNRAGTMANVTT